MNKTVAHPPLKAKKKQTKADFIRSWGLPYPSFQYHHLRYLNPPEKGVYWAYVSDYVRKRDVSQYGTCISCGKKITYETAQAGHFMPAANCGKDLLFDLRNVNAECEGCNAFDEAHLLGYAEGLDRRYGPGTATSLRNRREQYQARKEVVKDWKGSEYAEMVRGMPNYPLVEFSTGGKYVVVHYGV